MYSIPNNSDFGDDVEALPVLYDHPNFDIGDPNVIVRLSRYFLPRRLAAIQGVSLS